MRVQFTNEVQDLPDLYTFARSDVYDAVRCFVVGDCHIHGIRDIPGINKIAVLERAETLNGLSPLCLIEENTDDTFIAFSIDIKESEHNVIHAIILLVCLDQPLADDFMR